MSNMQRYLVFILTTLVLFELCGASGKVSLKLSHYNNQEGKTAEGECCDIWCSSPCDHYFIVCLDELSGSTSDFNQCRLGKHTIGETLNSNQITHVTTNPLVFPFTNWSGSARLKVQVWDADHNDADFVEQLYSEVQMEATNSTAEIKWENFEAKQRTRLGFSMAVRCDENWCPPKCDVSSESCKADGHNLSASSVKESKQSNLHRGQVAETKTGKTCQAWSSQFPHIHVQTANSFPEGNITDAKNYCRNPDSDPGGPWCYTTDPNTRWEHCDVPSSPATSVKECKQSKLGKDYRGQVAESKTGKTCQSWSSMFPHNHGQVASSFPDDSITEAKNYCRNPYGAPEGPWCYTTDPNLRWEYCDVPFCQGIRPKDQPTPAQSPLTSSVKECKQSKLGKDYRGQVAVTKKGKTCQAWSSKSPHYHGQTASRFPENNITDAKNYCRNPDGEPKGPWCYTTDPGVRWDYCDVPFCPGILPKDQLAPEINLPQSPLASSVKECKQSKLGKDYRGRVAESKTGKTCQAWNSTFPHYHWQNSSNFPEGNKTEAKNYCRNPDGEPDGPWCYTTDPKVRWEYCDVPLCLQGSVKECKQSKPRKDYRGRVAGSNTGKTCQAWSSQFPHNHTQTASSFPEGNLTEAKNYCRNPDSSPDGPWCYTTDPNTRWEYCNVPCATAVDPAQVDVFVEAEAKDVIPVITVKCNDSGNYLPEASLKDIFKSISAKLDKAESEKVGNPLDRTCLPHVIVVYARPRKNEQILPMRMMPRRADDADSPVPIRTGSVAGTNISTSCSVDEQAKGTFGLDDVLLAAVPLRNWSLPVDLNTKLMFGKHACALCGNLTLIVQVDPLGILNDTNPCNNFKSVNVTFDCQQCDNSDINPIMKQLPQLHPDQPLLKYCSADKNGGNEAFKVKNENGHFKFITIKQQDLALREMKFQLAYQILEKLRGPNGDCPACSNDAEDTCNVLSSSTATGNDDISEGQAFVTKMKSYISKLLSRKYAKLGLNTTTGNVEMKKRLSVNINSTVKCIFNKMKKAKHSEKCPFRPEVLPELYHSKYDESRNSTVQGQTRPAFNDKKSEDMVGDRYLDAIVDGMCPENSPDREKNARLVCTKGTKDGEAPDTPCYVQTLRNLLRENKSIRQKLFPDLKRNGTGQKLLSQRITRAFNRTGVSQVDLKNSSFWEVINDIDTICQPGPPAPGCPEKSLQTSFKQDGNKMFCGVNNPDGGGMCSVQCAILQCSLCQPDQLRTPTLFDHMPDDET